MLVESDSERNDSAKNIIFFLGKSSLTDRWGEGLSDVYSYSAGIDIRRQILTSKVDPRTVRLIKNCSFWNKNLTYCFYHVYSQTNTTTPMYQCNGPNKHESCKVKQLIIIIITLTSICAVWIKACQSCKFDVSPIHIDDLMFLLYIFFWT